MRLVKRTLLPWLAVLCLLAGSSAKEIPLKEVIGILGESATFRLETPSPLVDGIWHRKGAFVASFKQGPPCQLEPGDAYASRDMTVSPDCSSLTIRHLKEEDSGRYRALMRNSDSLLSEQNFTLKVYKRLSEADLEVSCAKEILCNGNDILHLNCSAGKWEDGVGFSWTTFLKTEVFFSSDKSTLLLYKPHSDDGKLTCRVENPVGQASRTVSLKQACAGTAYSSSILSSQVTVGVAIAALLVAKVFTSVFAN